jgi:cytochrome P450
MVNVGIRLELPIFWHIFSRIPIQAAQNFFRVSDRLRAAGYTAVRNTKDVNRESGQTIFSKMYPEGDAPLFPDSLMADEAGNLIVAGSDTTAVALTYVVYSVLANSDVKRKLLQELRAYQWPPSWDILENMDYLKNVIQETLRLYPSVLGTLPRSCPDEGAILCGYKIPGGITVGTQAYTFHRDLRVFEKPLRCAKN